MMTLTMNVMQVDQPIGVFYVGVMTAEELLSICKFDFRRMQYESGYIDFIGIQRRLSDKRVKEIARYAGTIDACFPTSVVISIDQKCAKLVESEFTGFFKLVVSEYIDSDDENMSIQFDKIASIIDGQHRMKGLSEADKPDFELPVCIFVGVDDATEASIFSTVNLAQTKVNKSLGYDLFALARKPSPEKTCHELTVALDRVADSPLQGRIKRLGVATEGRFGETLSQATVVQGILPYISSDPVGDRDRGKRFGFWEPATQQIFRSRIFYSFFADREDVKILEILINYFNAVKRKWPVAWAASGERNILVRTNGYIGLMRFLRPCYLYLTDRPTVVSESAFFEVFRPIQLVDEEFSPLNYLPGTSGSTKLYRDLMSQSHLNSV